VNLHKISQTEQKIITFQELIQQQESETLDFKSIPYNLSDDKKQEDLVKDIVCMCNTPREQDSHIVLGVKQLSDGTIELPGIDESFDLSQLDLSNLQAPFLEKFKVEPIPAFTIDLQGCFILMESLIW
jgi:predicted HTH transcriptional regulator